MSLAVVATEVMAIIIIGVILYGNLFEMKQKSQKRLSFIYLCIVAIATNVVDMLSYLPYSEKTEPALFIVVILDSMLPYVINAVFLSYLYVTVSEKVKVPQTLYKMGIYISGVAIIIELGLSLNDRFFYISNGKFHEGPLYWLFLLFYVVILIYTIVLVVISTTKVGIHDSIAAVLFLAIPIVFILLNIIVPKAFFAVASLAINMLVINIMLQADRENVLVESNQANMILAHHDELTSLPNRLAFVERIDRFERIARQSEQSEDIGVLFCDINALKYKNDNFGHVAGDKLICDFADVAREFFGATNIYRISGDEFVVFVTGTTDSGFKTRAESFIARLAYNRAPIASVGICYGSSSDIKALLDVAEGDMYNFKKKFYQKYPEYTR